jgi:hypothetical protein
VAFRAEVAQLVEHHLAKVRVAGSSPVFRSIPSQHIDGPRVRPHRDLDRCPFVQW